MEVKDIPVRAIRRPLPRQNDPDKVKALMDSIEAEGLHEPIEVLEVECRVRRAPRAVLEKHLA